VEVKPLPQIRHYIVVILSVVFVSRTQRCETLSSLPTQTARQFCTQTILLRATCLFFDQSVQLSKFPASLVHVPTTAFDGGVSDACTEVDSARIADGN
jgi:hypothetical protein